MKEFSCRNPKCLHEFNDFNGYKNHPSIRDCPKCKSSKGNVAYNGRSLAINLISDVADKPFKSMADGKVYDSKSSYRKELKARGFQEVGNDKQDVGERTKEISWDKAIKETLEGRH